MSYPLLGKDEIIEEQVLELIFTVGHIRPSVHLHMRWVWTTSVTMSMMHLGQVVSPGPQASSKEVLLSIGRERGRRSHCRIVGVGDWKTSLRSLVCRRDTERPFILSCPVQLEHPSPLHSHLSSSSDIPGPHS